MHFRVMVLGKQHPGLGFFFLKHLFIRVKVQTENHKTEPFRQWERMQFS